jgi:glyoxylase-like metal-dependent hydrolase (beta-lactamase superfamily II)
MSEQTRGLPIVSPWFSVERLACGVTLLSEPHVHELLRANVWLVEGRARDLVIDAGNGIGDLAAALAPLRSQPDKPLVAVLTHAHPDHQGGLWQLEERLAHRLEIAELEHPSIARTLLGASYPQEVRETMADEGLALPATLIDALPQAGFDPASFTLVPCSPTRLVEEGDRIDLGDRAFRVLHLPGHSPGGVGLWEEASGVLFAGDVVYDGALLDDLPGANVRDYVHTMRRLRELPVDTVHAGHDASFGRARLIEIADAYITHRAAS